MRLTPSCPTSPVPLPVAESPDDLDLDFIYRVAFGLICRYGASAHDEVELRLAKIYDALGKVIAVQAAIAGLQCSQAPGPDDVIN